MGEFVMLDEGPTGDASGSGTVRRKASELMEKKELVQLEREVEAVVIPSGERTRLPAGTPVRVMQALGGTFTVMTELGFMARIAGEDADALGAEPPPAPAQEAGSAEDTEAQVWEQLKTCFDPEIPINIVDLGLVYKCELKPLPEGGQRAELQFTLTAPGCGMGEVLKRDIEEKLRRVPGVKEAAVEVVLEPPWDMSKMSEAARLQLGLM